MERDKMGRKESASLLMSLKEIIPTITIIILILIITVLAIFNIIAAENKSGFTELYFVDDLPKTIKMNEEYLFSFAIRNLENKKMVYNYEVYLQSNKIGQGYLNLDHDHTIIVSQSFMVKNESKNVSIPVSVRLLNKDQEIHFWVSLK